jgi:hypothetical protein
MQIKITSCSDRMYWYNDLIGFTFEVIRFEKPDLFWVREPSGYLNFVRSKDCQVLKSTYSVENFWESCKKFNIIAGKDKVNSWEELGNQAKLIAEEANEITEAIEAQDICAVLDGCIDVLVTAFGLKQQLQNLGVDVNLAMNLVAENNLSKFPTEEEKALKTKQYYDSLGIPTNVYSKNYNSETYYVVKDKSMKVRKPVDFKSVKLDNCIPPGIDL